MTYGRVIYSQTQATGSYATGASRYTPEGGEVLKKKGQDWKEIEEKLESVKVKEIVWADAAKNGVWGFSDGRDRPRVAEEKTGNAWRKPGPANSRPESASGCENGSAVNTENGNGHIEEAGEGETHLLMLRLKDGGQHGM